MLSIEKITTREAFEQIRPAWNVLLGESSSNTITLTWEWLTTWWDVFGAERELYILLIRDGKDLIGIAPLLRRTVRHLGLLPFRRLEFLASGEFEEDEICSDYLDFILRRGREGEALAAILCYLGEREPDWDEFLLTDISGESPNLKPLQEICGINNIKLNIAREQVCLYLPLPSNSKALDSTIGWSLRKKTKRDRRIMQRSGGELRVIDNLEGFEENFKILISLHQNRWNSRGKSGAFASEKFTRFHRTVAPKLLRKGWLKLLVLIISGEAVSAKYVLAYNNKVHDYQNGFIQSNEQPSGSEITINSPGSLITRLCIENAIEAGSVEFDFLKGQSDSYKSRWGCQTRSILQLRLAKSRSREALYHTTSSFIGLLKQVRRTFRRYAASLRIQ